MVLPSVFNQPLPVLRAHVGCIHYSEASASKALGQHIVERVESVAGCRLVVLIIADEAREKNPTTALPLAENDDAQMWTCRSRTRR